MAQVLKGLPVAQAIVANLKPRIQRLYDKGVKPTLAIVRVGSREDDLAYERGAMNRCAKAGVAVRVIKLAEDCSQEELLSAIDKVNGDGSIHGCLLFRPLPKHLNEVEACEALDPKKDVDCITRASMCSVFTGSGYGYPPCTAQACIELLDHYGVELDGTDVTVLGRSLVIGKPVSMMLQARHATVTMCHTHTQRLSDKCRAAQVLVVAAGHPATVGADDVSEGQVVIDVGINWDDKNQRLCGDVAYDEVAERVQAITPVPGGLGSVTTAVLVKHVVMAAERACED